MEISEKIRQHILNEIISRKDILEYIEENLEFKIKNHHKKGRHFIVDSLPACGKDFLSMLMVNLTGFEADTWHHTFNNQTDMNLYPPKMVDSYSKDIIISGLDPSPWLYDMELLKKFNADAIFVIGDIFDTIVRLRELYLNKLRKPEYICLDSLGFYSMSFEQQLDIIIEMDLRLIAGQYASWRRAERDLGLSVMFISYNDLILNSYDTARMISEHFELSKSDEEIKIAVQKTQAQETNNFSNFIGKGDSLLTDSQKQKINEFRKFYKGLK